ncbi:ulp1 protease family, C-terminal catalytic domain-containing protein [Tanacetum coccineum]
MDRRKWMYSIERATPKYIKGLSKLIKIAKDHQAKTGEAQISCPCKDRAHFIYHDDIETIRYHLFKQGFTGNYTWWKHHGEAPRDCTSYIDGIPDIGVPESRHDGRLEGKGTIGRNDVTPNNHDFEQAHFTILQNMTSIAPYIHEHLHWLGMGHK